MVALYSSPQMKTPLFTLLASLLLVACLTSCGQTYDYEDRAVEHIPPPDEPIFMEIVITAGEQTLEGVLFDNSTAKAIAAMLPLTVDLWHPAEGFARAFDLPEQIPDVEQRTRQYEQGGLAYWFEGPSVAIFYGDYLRETIVPVVTVGRLTDDVDYFADYGGSITINQKDVSSQ